MASQRAVRQALGGQRAPIRTLLAGPGHLQPGNGGRVLTEASCWGGCWVECLNLGCLQMGCEIRKCLGLTHSQTEAGLWAILTNHAHTHKYSQCGCIQCITLRQQPPRAR